MNFDLHFTESYLDRNPISQKSISQKSAMFFLRTYAFISSSSFSPVFGSIHLILGPMFSGKTTELHRRLRRQEYAHRKVLLVKSVRDSRYTQNHAVNSTHDKNTFRALAVNELREVGERVRDVDVVGIDEGQFFHDIAEFSERLANEGKVVVVAALNGTFQKEHFGNVHLLYPKAESIDKLTAVCNCGNEAHFTKRFSESKEIIEVGGAEKYKAVCRACYQL